MRLKFVMLSALMGSLALVLGSAPGHTRFAGDQRVHPPAGNLLGTGPAKHEQTARADNFDGAEAEPVVPQSWMDERFRRLDKDGDGYLSYDEMTENLKAERDLWDHNKDGKIDLAEWREYVEAFIAHQRRSGTDPGGPAQLRGAREPGQGPAAQAPGRGQRSQGSSILQALKARAASRSRAAQTGQGPVPRPAKPGINLPPGFKEYDTDGDGQIALHEWKARNGTVEDFLKYDLDGDGFITLEELIRAGRITAKTGFLPPEFRRYDTDGDGQIALHEWKDKNRSVEDFLKYDRDGDGFLTPEELMLAGSKPALRPNLPMLSSSEREYLRNLHQRSSWICVGSEPLREELRRLRAMGLIETPKFNLYEMWDGHNVNLHDFARISERGRQFLRGRLE